MKRILTVLATGFAIAMAPYAQAQNATLPNAPVASAVDSTTQLRDSTAGTIASNIPGPAAATVPAASADADVSLYTVVDLALRNSRTVRMAEAVQQRARAVWMETRDIYVPNFSIGSGLGYSYGFPLGNPTLFNVQSNFLLFSFSQRDYIRSAHAAAKAATLSLKNTREQVILDAALHYVELNKTLGKIVALQEAFADSNKLVEVMEDRWKAGLETKMDLTQARLTRALTQLQMIQMEDHADELRKHLSVLTGLQSDEITPIASSIPQLPDLNFQELMSKENDSPAVESTFASADARMYNAWGDEKQNRRPTVIGVFQYNRFASFNGYDQYYRNFTPNNVGIGINATWPLFDRVKRDKARESAADAKHDRQQAEIAKTQNDENNLALWHGLRELEAQEHVADLQQQLAQDTLAATLTQIAGNGQPVAPQTADQYRIDERNRYIGLEDAQFNVIRAKLDLLTAIGGLEDWAKESAQGQTSSSTAKLTASPH